MQGWLRTQIRITINFKITTYHFYEEADDRISGSKIDFSSKHENNDYELDTITIIKNNENWRKQPTSTRFKNVHLNGKKSVPGSL